MLANWSKLSDTACWIGMAKSCSTADTTWLRPSNRPASILLAPVLRAFGMNRSRGMDSRASLWWVGSACRIMMTSLFTPLTPWEQSP